MQRLGEGRGFEVYGNGEKVLKVAKGGRSFPRLFNAIFYGAHPYAVSPHAGTAAEHRSIIVAELFKYWFEGELRALPSKFLGYDEKLGGHVIEKDRIYGGPPRLQSPGNPGEYAIIQRLAKRVQAHAEESGLEGLVWQAGRGHPCAVPNFMKDANGFILVDMESGMPAIAPLNPKRIGYYFGKAFKYGHPMCDDVDIGKLIAYLKTNRKNIEIFSGPINHLFEHINQLAYHQTKLWEESNVERGVGFAFQHSEITKKQSEKFLRHPGLWYSRVIGKASLEAFNFVLGEIPYKLIDLAYQGVKGFFRRKGWKLFYDQEFQEKVFKEYSNARINTRKERGHITEEKAQALRKQAEHISSSQYASDFSFQIGLSLVEKVASIFVPATLLASRTIGPIPAFALYNFGGVIIRTAYTGTRMALNLLKPEMMTNIPKYTANTFNETCVMLKHFGVKKTGKHLLGKVIGLPRMVALIVGLTPHLGLSAYPAQMVYSLAAEENDIGGFLIDDIFSSIARIIPVYGGADTGTEHWANHLSYSFTKKIQSLNN